MTHIDNPICPGPLAQECHHNLLTWAGHNSAQGGFVKPYPPTGSRPCVYFTIFAKERKHALTVKPGKVHFIAFCIAIFNRTEKRITDALAEGGNIRKAYGGVQMEANKLWQEFDQRLKAVAAGLDRHHLAEVCGVSYPYINQILNSNGDQRPFQLKHVPVLAVEAPELFMREVIGWLCNLMGVQPEPANAEAMCEAERLKVMEQLRVAEEAIRATRKALAV